MAPTKKYNAGSISCALWENDMTTQDGRKIRSLKATAERRYTDKTGAWKSSNSFSRNEIPLVIWALQKAFDHMIEHGNERTSDDSPEEELVVRDDYQPRSGPPTTAAHRSIFFLTL